MFTPISIHQSNVQHPETPQQNTGFLACMKRCCNSCSLPTMVGIKKYALRGAAIAAGAIFAGLSLGIVAVTVPRIIAASLTGAVIVATRAYQKDPLSKTPRQSIEEKKETTSSMQKKVHIEARQDPLKSERDDKKEQAPAQKPGDTYKRHRRTRSSTEGIVLD